MEYGGTSVNLIDTTDVPHHISPFQLHHYVEQKHGGGMFHTILSTPGDIYDVLSAA